MTPSTYYTQGYYNLINPPKYRGTFPIVYRSRPEYMIMRWLDLNPHVLSWTSENTVIPYRRPQDNMCHRYYVDFSCQYQDSHGEVSTMLLEYKPKKFTVPPVKTKRMSQRTYVNLCETWSKNQAKWAAAKDFANAHNAKFLVISEEHIGLECNK